MNWTPQAINTLETMWLWGHSSGAIAQTLQFPSRNAVMGKVNRLGLMRRGGEYVGARLKDAELDVTIIKEELEALTGSVFDWNDATDRALLVHMAALFVGQDAETIAGAIQQPLSDVAKVLGSMHRTGVWTIGGKPPVNWWHDKEGNVAFLLDAMVTAGLISLHDYDGERHYGKAGSNLEGEATAKLSRHIDGVCSDKGDVSAPMPIPA